MTAVLIWVLLYGAVCVGSRYLAELFSAPYISSAAVFLFVLCLVSVMLRRGTAARYRLRLADSLRPALILSAPPTALVLWLAVRSGQFASSEAIHTLIPMGLAAFLEELLFRGALPVTLRQCFHYKKTACVLAADLLFALLHAPDALSGAALSYAALHVLFAFCAGLCFSGLTERTGSILPAALLHFAVNLSAAPKADTLSPALYIAVSAALLLYGSWQLYKDKERNK